MVIGLITSASFGVYGFLNHFNEGSYPNNIPWHLKFDIHQTNMKAIDVKIPSYDGGLMQIQDGDNIITFPSNWFKGLKDFRIVNCYEYNLTKKEVEYCKKDDGESNVMGTHYHYLRLILIDENLKKKMFELTVIHEIGHHIWSFQLNKSFKKGWCKNYDNQTRYITGYAYSECEEDFAEAFAVYYLKGKVMEHELILFKEIEGVLFK